MRITSFALLSRYSGCCCGRYSRSRLRCRGERLAQSMAAAISSSGLSFPRRPMESRGMTLSFRLVPHRLSEKPCRLLLKRVRCGQRPDLREFLDEIVVGIESTGIALMHHGIKTDCPQIRLFLLIQYDRFRKVSEVVRIRGLHGCRAGHANFNWLLLVRHQRCQKVSRLRVISQHVD